ncbi:MAG: hypothetical protein ABIJ65_07015 [Chloroflexota bacterium]
MKGFTSNHQQDRSQIFSGGGVHQHAHNLCQRGVFLVGLRLHHRAERNQTAGSRGYGFCSNSEGIFALILSIVDIIIASNFPVPKHTCPVKVACHGENAILGKVQGGSMGFTLFYWSGST